MRTPRVAAKKRSSVLFSLPSTAVGRWSAWLLVAGLVLVLLNTLVVMPITEGRTGLELVQNASNLIVGLSVVSSGLGALYAVIVQRERSWVAGVAILVFAAVMALMLQDLTTAG